MADGEMERRDPPAGVVVAELGRLRKARRL